MTTFDPARAERFLESLQPKPASKLMFNLTFEHDWMLKKQQEIMRDLMLLLERYPAGTYQVGIVANHVMKDWQYVGVGLKQPHNIMTAYPFYAGQVTKFGAQGGQ